MFSLMGKEEDWFFNTNCPQVPPGETREATRPRGSQRILVGLVAAVLIVSSLWTLSPNSTRTNDALAVKAPVAPV